MTLSIGIRSITREPDYLQGLLARLFDVGVFDDARVLGLHVNYGEGLTPNENGCRALERAALDAPDWVLFFEDDMDVIDDFLGSIERWMTKYERPDIHLYPLGCNYSQCFLPDSDCWLYGVSKYYQSGCFLLRADKVAHLCDFMRTRPPVSRERCFDLNIARWHQEIEPQTEYLHTPVPCFVNHVGEVSSMGCAVGTFAGFAGRDYSYGI